MVILVQNLSRNNCVGIRSGTTSEKFTRPTKARLRLGQGNLRYLARKKQTTLLVPHFLPPLKKCEEANPDQNFKR